MHVHCHRCGAQTTLTSLAWRCGCGGAWEPVLPSAFDPACIEQQDVSIWRYGHLMGLDLTRPLRRMGVGGTPLASVSLFGRQVHLKLEYLSPSGSFKDRGMNAMVNQLATMGVTTVVEDSSGNAGASLAAHAARFGLKAQIFVPAYASPAKLRQIAVYGADVRPIAGPRMVAAEAAQNAITPQTAYASHAYHPAYLAGQMTVAWEIWEQCGRRAPDWLILPAAQGGQLLGSWLGFKSLLAAGLITKLPRLAAVQAARCAPIHRAWSLGWDQIPAVEADQPTVAEGAAIPRPVRDQRILQALAESDGLALAVAEDEILSAQKALAHKGYDIEPTSALAPAGLRQIVDQIGEKDRVVMTLTGNGLKGQPDLEAVPH